jgi:hypothetical protein
MLMKYMNPVAMLAKAKKKQDITSSVLVLFSASVIFGVAGALGLSGMRLLTALTGTNLALVALSVFTLVFVTGLFFGWILQTVAAIIGTKNSSFFSGLTSVAYSLLYLSIGFLLSAIFGFIPNVMGVMVSSFASLVVFGAIGYSTLLRAVRELFETDLLTAFVIVSVVMGMAFFGFYMMAMLSGALSGTLLGTGSALA